MSTFLSWLNRRFREVVAICKLAKPAHPTFSKKIRVYGPFPMAALFENRDLLETPIEPLILSFAVGRKKSS
jgi:hypothetical protein